MPETQPDILLVDDGELADLASQLDALGVEYAREVGPRPGGSLAPPNSLLIATPRRTGSVRRGSPPDAAPGRPTRVVAVGEDETTSARRLLRRTGFHLAVQMPLHDEILKLLAGHALYAGDERRGDARIAVGSATSVTTGEGSGGAMLMDVSNRGCRIVSQQPFEVGQMLEVRIPDRESGEAPLVLPGRVARVGYIEGNAAHSHAAAVVFAADLRDEDRMQLGVLINRWSVGPASLGESASVPSVPVCESPEIPGLLLDDETDPAVRVDAAVDVAPTSATEAPTDERRDQGRRSFAVPVIARHDERRRMLIGRDLSTRGMRVEPHGDLSVGDAMRLALYGADSPEPLVVQATVSRDDGDAGLALRFDELPREAAGDLEKLVACLPDLDSLDDGEAFGLGAVVGEVLSQVAEDQSEDA